MSEQNHPSQQPGTGVKLVIPFFLALAILTVVSFIIPLRPTQSQMEKRNLAQFPEFSWSALAEGTYFDDITTWFSDTFPGRESWLTLSSSLTSLHGYSEIAIAGDLPVVETIPTIPSEPRQEEIILSTQPTSQEPSSETAPLETVPAETQWGGVDAGDPAEIELTSGAIIQIGNSAFNAVGFSQSYSDTYAAAINHFVSTAAEYGIRVVSAPAPTAVGILVEKEYLEQLNCADQEATINYLHSQMDDSVYKVDTYNALVPHNDEYIYFRTDHHWTALGAYYAYEAICEALDMEAVPLSECEEWNQGEFEGSLYWKARNPRKLKLDELIAYVPPFDIQMWVRGVWSSGMERPLIQDMTNRERNAKYSAFIFSDNAMTEIVNNDLPDGPTCILVKDSFGNCLAPFLAQNYHKVYVLDYRKFHETNLTWFLKDFEVDDVIFAPYVIATQSSDGGKLFTRLCQ